MSIDDMLNCWLLCSSADERFTQQKTICSYVLNVTAKTEVLQSETSEGDGVAIIGYCVDAHGECPRAQVPSFLCVSEMDEFLRRIVRLAGSYVVIRYGQSGIQIFGDATHMMSVFYGCSADGGVHAGAYEFLVAEKLGAVQSEESLRVTRGAYDFGVILAGDMTLYDGIKALMPNHYLDFGDRMAKRYFPMEELKMTSDSKDIEDVIDRTLKLSKNVLRGYAETFEIMSPLTSGYDSRVITAIALNVLPKDKVRCYTTRIKSLGDAAPDLIVSRQMAIDFGIEHRFITYLSAPKERREFLMSTLGNSRSWSGDYEWTCEKLFPGKAIFNGQLIGQIGKSSMGNNLPEWVATPTFLMTKQRNTSRLAKKKTEEWFTEAKARAFGYSMFDLWGWEIRCGRWNSNSVSVCAASGLMRLNIFNCTEVLSEWCRIPRRIRYEQCVVHKGMLEKLDRRFLDYPFNPDERMASKLKAIPLVFWLGSWGKYWAAKFDQVKKAIKDKGGLI